MEYGNVLVIGNSGVGKSTLINAVLGDAAEEKAPTSVGIRGTTKELRIYESDAIPFRIIDTIGFEPSFFKRNAAIKAVKKWSKESAKDENSDKKINVIWFCVEGTSSKLFPESIKSLSKATAMWESVPVIVVITKSYSEPDRKANIQMVNNAFATQKRYSKNLKGVIPVVAQTFTLNDTAFAAPEGISELIDATNAVMPEGIKAATKDISAFKLKRKRALAQSVVGASTAGGAVVGAVPVPIADAMILSPLEVAEINAIAKIYEIKDNKDSKRFINSIVEVGTASAAAKAAISALKAIPGVNLAASVLNAVIAAGFVAAIGEGSIYAFEKVYIGEKTVDDIDWIKRFMESKLSNEFIDKATEAIKKVSENGGSNNISAVITDIVTQLFAPKTSDKNKEDSKSDSE
ncbi:DUF697 domain-containing protein [Eggerthellaceae bacterium zg-887]|uniref:GTPase n=1 Tax=Xiamenia xianingshaonis TaxID=2682776 RepID=UPI00140A0D74|nr:GTP-binding DUF697 domain-containing protein [Xiamenia xianingshaonis]NHM17024.1 DUF697 domain-containing protein [Xiamenia xianingshaonis]